LSVTETVPLNAPAAAGWNATVKVQVAAAASVLPQLLVGIVKEDALLPPTAIEVMPSGADPVFFKVTVCGADVAPTAVLGKLSLAGVNVTAGAVPVPFKATVCGDPEASSVTARVALKAPATVGANATPIVQFVPVANAPPQVFGPMTKDDALGPQRAIEPMVNAAVPVLASVSVCAGAVDFTCVAAKPSTPGNKVATVTPLPRAVGSTVKLVSAAALQVPFEFVV
jgi:hypothetical protein